jgi:hypothetical protein
LARGAFSSETGPRLVEFQPVTVGPENPLDIRIILGNRRQVRPDGRLPSHLLGLDSRGVGWVPTALLLALTLATPLPWRRRLIAAVGGLVLIHLFLLASVWIYLLNNSDTASGLKLVELQPWQKTIVEGLEETFITQMGPGFAVAVVVWMGVAFQRGDGARLFGLLRGDSPAPAATAPEMGRTIPAAPPRPSKKKRRS